MAKNSSWLGEYIYDEDEYEVGDKSTEKAYTRVVEEDANQTIPKNLMCRTFQTSRVATA